jgi:phosphoribosylamine--glycine ligase
MNILVIDGYCGLGLDTCLRFITAGHTVKWFIDKDDKGHVADIGDGLVSKVKDWRKWMDWCDFVFLTDNIMDFLPEIRKYRKNGYLVWGGDDLTAKCELDRNLGQDIFKKAGIKTMEYEGPFKDFDAGIDYIRENPGRWVSKPCGTETDKSLSYVSKSAGDMIFMLKKWKENGSKQEFILQKFKPGLEMAVAGHFGPKGFNKYFLEGWEFKKHMPSDLGVNTGEQGTVVRYVQESKLADAVLRPVEDYLHSINYTGFVDVNCIIDEEDGTPYPLEFTARCGWPCWNIQQPLHEGDPAQWIYDLLRGQDTQKVIENKVCVGVVLAHGSYPLNLRPSEEEVGFPVYTDKAYADYKNIHPCEVKLGEVTKFIDGQIIDVPDWVTAGTYVLQTTGVDDTVKGAADKAYAIMKKIELPNNAQYRDDIGEKLEKDLPKLQNFGFAVGMKYKKD